MLPSSHRETGIPWNDSTGGAARTPAAFQYPATCSQQKTANWGVGTLYEMLFSESSGLSPSFSELRKRSRIGL